MFKKHIWLHEDEYRAMTPKVAKKYFEWFVENIPIVMEALQAELGDEVILDYTPKSLIPLEAWFLPKRRYVELTEKQILEDNANAPKAIKDYIIQEAMESRFVPTVGTYYMAAGIGIYIREVFVKNDADLYWDYVKKPKSDVRFHEPVVNGFSPIRTDVKYMKTSYFISPFDICKAFHASSPQGAKQKNSWYDAYNLAIENKEMFYHPDYFAEMLMQKLEEQLEKDKREGKFKEGEVIIMPGSTIEPKTVS